MAALAHKFPTPNHLFNQIYIQGNWLDHNQQVLSDLTEQDLKLIKFAATLTQHFNIGFVKPDSVLIKRIVPSKQVNVRLTEMFTSPLIDTTAVLTNEEKDELKIMLYRITEQFLLIYGKIPDESKKLLNSFSFRKLVLFEANPILRWAEENHYQECERILGFPVRKIT